MNVLLAKPYPIDMDPSGWYMSEKLDGIRAYWTGKRLLTRNGNTIHAPDWFTQCLPDEHLDGELWVGRGKFPEATSIVRSESVDKGWSTITYQVFDLPSLVMPFGHRMSELARMTRHLGKHVKCVAQVRCTGRDHLSNEMDRAVALGGEGLMLRKPGSLYERKRSSTLLKVKRFHDTEARVLAHVDGKGKHKGRLGALTCMLKSGATFEVGTGFTDAEREAPPRVGAKVTVRYQELSRDGVPRFPVYVTERDYE